MKVSIEFDPSLDLRADVTAQVERAYGVAADAGKTAEPAKAVKTAGKTEKAAEPKKADGPDREAVRTKLKELVSVDGKDAAIAVLKSHGAASIGELDEAQFAAVVAKTQELIDAGSALG
jgi:hypothetical protein